LPVVTAVLAPALVKLFPSAPPRVEIAASTVGEMIDELNERWPGMRDRLVDSTPRIRRHINVFVRGERAKLETLLTDSSEVYVLTAISGG
jgi:molybdopterin converting factor small subunit